MSRLSFSMKPIILTILLIIIYFPLKYHNNYWMDCHHIIYRHLGSPEDESYWLQLSPDFLSSTCKRLTFGFLVRMSQKLLDGLPYLNHKTDRLWAVQKITFDCSPNTHMLSLESTNPVSSYLKKKTWTLVGLHYVSHGTLGLWKSGSFVRFRQQNSHLHNII